jgi:hypothetical protein
MDWTSFYVTTAGASATLVGLLFVGVQFNIDLFLDDQTNRWNAVARSTFEIFTLLFLISLCFLVPALNDDGRSKVILIAVTIGAVRAVVTWRPVARSAGALLRADQFARSFWLLLAPIILYSVLALAAIGYYANQPSPLDQFTVAVGLIGLFSVCLRNSWRLLFDVAMEGRKKGKD